MDLNFVCLTYQLSIVRVGPSMLTTENQGLVTEREHKKLATTS